MRPIYRFAILCLMLLPVGAYAATYSMAQGSRPPCSTNWSVNGNTYTCGGNGRVTLANSDIIAAPAASIQAVGKALPLPLRWLHCCWLSSPANHSVSPYLLHQYP